MGDFLYGVSWIFDILMLDLRRQSLPALVASTVAWGLFAALFTVIVFVGLTWPMSVGNALGRIVVFLIGLGLWARIVQGWMFYWRYTRTGRAPPPQMLSES